MVVDNRLITVKDFRVYRRNLPHWEHPGSVYFITFKTAKGFTLSNEAKDITFTSIKFRADKKYKLYSCVVMDSHVHSVLQPVEESEGVFYSIAQIMHSIKSYSANMIQRVLNKRGKIWQDESYDRIVRDDEEYLDKMDYVIYNSLKAGLVEKPEDYKWLFYEGSDNIQGRRPS